MLTELNHLLAPLNTALFTLGNDHVTVAELLGFVTGAASVWLTVRASARAALPRSGTQQPGRTRVAGDIARAI